MQATLRTINTGYILDWNFCFSRAHEGPEPDHGTEAFAHLEVALTRLTNLFEEYEKYLVAGHK